MSVVIVDYGSGNLRSAAKAFERAIDDINSSEKVTVTGAPEMVARASRIVLPGVGAFADCKSGLAAVDGMIEALTEAVIRLGRPFLGICVGMQLLADWGREHGDTPGFGWIPGEVVPITPSDNTLKIPHMGWNNLDFLPDSHPLLEEIQPAAHAYFVHSYRFVCAEPGDQKATTDYDGPVAAIIGRDNLAGTQFHPEKSQSVGLRLIGNFLQWKP